MCIQNETQTKVLKLLMILIDEECYNSNHVVEVGVVSAEAKCISRLNDSEKKKRFILRNVSEPLAWQSFMT